MAERDRMSDEVYEEIRSQLPLLKEQLRHAPEDGAQEHALLNLLTDYHP